MLYYFLLLLFGAHITLFWLGNISKNKEMVMFAVLLGIVTTYTPLWPGVQVPKPDGGVFAIQDPVLAFISFVLTVLYAMWFVKMSALEFSKAQRVYKWRLRW